MLGCKERGQFEIIVAGSLYDLVPDDHVLKRVDRVLDLSCCAAKSSNAMRQMLDGQVLIRRRRCD